MQNEIPLLLHPPKTGGSSILNALIETHGADRLPMFNNYDPFADKREVQTAIHWTYHRFKLPKDYPAVITVRNPYTRCWSLFQHSVQVNSAQVTDIKLWFETFLKNCIRRRNPNTATASRWLVPQVKDIIRYETFAQDVKRVYDIDINTFPHIHNTGAVADPWQLQSVYTQTSLDSVNYLMSADFQEFGYKHAVTVEQLKPVLYK